MSALFRRFTAKRADPLPEAPASVTPRDTDADWRDIGAKDPYFGVLSHPRFRRDHLSDDALADFFLSGEHEIAGQFAQMKSLYPDFAPKSALDFGCGVGRLTRPLAALTGDATGFDVSPGMLAEARKYQGSGATFTTDWPERQFEWVLSLIVLQHITPEQGHEAIGRLLKAVAPGGGITLQVTYARRVECGGVGYRLMIEGDDVRAEECPVDTGAVEQGIMIMHDYDLGRVVAQFVVAGLTSLHIETTDHGGHIGATIYARRPT